MRHKVTLNKMYNYDKSVFDYIWKQAVLHACAGGEKEESGHAGKLDESLQKIKSIFW